MYRFFANIKNNLFWYPKKSYSLCGEDIILSYFIIDIDKVKNGFYIDIGACSPVKISNTYYFYKKGWQGINIDAKPGSMTSFNRKRRRDINLEIGISKNEGNLDFYTYEVPFYNTFSKDLAYSRKNNGLSFEKIETVKTKRLENVLDQYLPKNKKIDFMSIDVEGLDLEVLESNNWDKYKPNYILIETQDKNLENVKDSIIYKFLTNKNYKLISIADITLIFKYEVKL